MFKLFDFPKSRLYMTNNAVNFINYINKFYIYFMFKNIPVYNNV